MPPAVIKSVNQLKLYSVSSQINEQAGDSIQKTLYHNINININYPVRKEKHMFQD